MKVSEKFAVFMVEDAVDAERKPIKTLKKFSEFDTEELANNWVQNYLDNARHNRSFLISKVYSNV